MVDMFYKVVLNLFAVFRIYYHTIHKHMYITLGGGAQKGTKLKITNVNCLRL